MKELIKDTAEISRSEGSRETVWPEKKIKSVCRLCRIELGGRAGHAELPGIPQVISHTQCYL